MHAGEWLTAKKGHTCRANGLPKGSSVVHRNLNHKVVPNKAIDTALFKYSGNVFLYNV